MAPILIPPSYGPYSHSSHCTLTPSLYPHSSHCTLTPSLYPHPLTVPSLLSLYPHSSHCTLTPLTVPSLLSLYPHSSHCTLTPLTVPSLLSPYPHSSHCTLTLDLTHLGLCAGSVRDCPVQFDGWLHWCGSSDTPSGPTACVGIRVLYMRVA